MQLHAFNALVPGDWVRHLLTGHLYQVAAVHTRLQDCLDEVQHLQGLVQASVAARQERDVFGEQKQVETGRRLKLAQARTKLEAVQARLATELDPFLNRVYFVRLRANAEGVLAPYRLTSILKPPVVELFLPEAP